MQRIYTEYKPITARSLVRIIKKSRESSLCETKNGKEPTVIESSSVPHDSLGVKR